MSKVRDRRGPAPPSHELLTTQLDMSATRSQTGQAEQRAYLIARLGADTEVVTLTEGSSLTVGRATEADLTVDDARVSRTHARLSYEASELRITDLGSRNGTTVAGTVLRKAGQRLAHGSAVTIGPLELMVVAVPGSENQAGQRQAVPSATTIETEEDIVVEDPKMQDLFRKAQRVAAVATTVLLVGETGVGKEVLAEVIHQHSPRSHGPLVRLNCVAVPESLIESELFGHEKGAFTGATGRKSGYIEAAHGGTLFLDEIGDLPASAQTKLLRALETKRVQRLGTTAEIEVDVRFICATHRDLEALVTEGTFRQDLFYRVAAFTLEIPPLRARTAEIKPLAERFARRFAARNGLPQPELPPEVVQALEAHEWPGNVRELRNAVEHAVVLSEGASIGVAALPRTIRASDDRKTNATDETDKATMRAKRDEAELRAIEEALAKCSGNRAQTAELLGISLRSLQYKLAKYGLSKR